MLVASRCGRRAGVEFGPRHPVELLRRQVGVRRRSTPTIGRWDRERDLLGQVIERVVDIVLLAGVRGDRQLSVRRRVWTVPLVFVEVPAPVLQADRLLV